VSIPRRLGRLARGFVLNLQEDDRFRETLRVGRERGETLKETFGEAFGAAWRGAAEEWRTAEEERLRGERPETGGPGGRSGDRNGAGDGGGAESGSRRWSYSSTTFAPRKFPVPVLTAYQRLGLDTGAGLEEVSRKRRELVKRYHPDRFSDPEKRARAERLTAEINAAHDTIARHFSGGARRP
jgi:DnaJ-domain-containing protein 1